MLLVGRARVIGTVHGEDVLSGIDKKAMAVETAYVGALGIEGDGNVIAWEVSGA